MKIVDENHIACPVCGSRVNESYKIVAEYQIVAYALNITPQMGSVMSKLLQKIVVTHDELLGAMALHAISEEHAYEHLKVAISRLRSQIKDRGWKVNNVWKIGYSLDPEARAEALKLIEAARADFESGEDRSTVAA